MGSVVNAYFIGNTNPYELMNNVDEYLKKWGDNFNFEFHYKTTRKFLFRIEYSVLIVVRRKER